VAGDVLISKGRQTDRSAERGAERLGMQPLSCFLTGNIGGLLTGIPPHENKQ